MQYYKLLLLSVRWHLLFRNVIIKYVSSWKTKIITSLLPFTEEPLDQSIRVPFMLVKAYLTFGARRP